MWPEDLILGILRKDDRAGKDFTPKHKFTSFLVQQIKREQTVQALSWHERIRN